jgi:hypothetical protein
MYPHHNYSELLAAAGIFPAILLLQQAVKKSRKEV